MKLQLLGVEMSLHLGLCCGALNGGLCLSLCASLSLTLSLYLSISASVSLSWSLHLFSWGWGRREGEGEREREKGGERGVLSMKIQCEVCLAVSKVSDLRKIRDKKDKASFCSAVRQMMMSQVLPNLPPTKLIVCICCSLSPSPIKKNVC